MTENRRITDKLPGHSLQWDDNAGAEQAASPAAAPAAGQAGLAKLPRYRWGALAMNREPVEGQGYHLVKDVEEFFATLAAPVAATEQATSGALIDILTDYLRREMPAGTVICRPDWWAVKIARAIAAAPLATPADAGAGKALSDARIAELNREAQDQGISGIAPSIYLARAVEREVLARMSTSPAPVTAEPAQNIHENEEVRQAVAEGLRRLWGCGRVWSAWNVGTMSEEDFYAADESDECIDQMIHAIAFLIAPAPADRDAIRVEVLDEVLAVHRQARNWEAADAVRALKSMERAADAAETRDAKGGEHA